MNNDTKTLESSASGDGAKEQAGVISTQEDVSLDEQ